MASNINKWKIEQYEMGFFAPNHSYTSSPLRLQIPKLMPLIDRNKAKVFNPERVSDSCYCNAKECKPRVGNSIVKQNYFTVPIYKDNEFKESHMKHGDPVKLYIRNGNIYDMWVIDEIDKSHVPLAGCPDCD